MCRLSVQRKKSNPELHLFLVFRRAQNEAASGRRKSETREGFSACFATRECRAVATIASDKTCNGVLESPLAYLDCRLKEGPSSFGVVLASLIFVYFFG